MSGSVHSRVREAREATYREAVLEAAEQVFADQGYDGARMADIAAAAGISLGTLYKVCDGKESLRRELHHMRAQQILQRSLESLPPDATPLERMRYGMHAYVRFQVDHPACLRMNLREARFWSIAGGLDLPEQLEAWTVGFDLVVQTVEEGIALGEIVDERPQQHARMMIAILQVVLSDWVEGGMEDGADALVGRLDRAMIRAFAAARTPEEEGCGRS